MKPSKEAVERAALAMWNQVGDGLGCARADNFADIPMGGGNSYLKMAEAALAAAMEPDGFYRKGDSAGYEYFGLIGLEE